jgi:ppGpp synthetase/RelA/SpoT-type nucleotidyltranferase
LNRIESGPDILEQVIQVFETECKTALREKQLEIINHIKVVLDLKCHEHELEYKNSVYSGKYYSLIGRVKSKESLSEKFIRKSQILDIVNDYSIRTVTDIKDKKPELISFFERYEDIIGIKILTEVKHDCIKVFELLKGQLDVLREKGVIFFDFDEKQPKPMKNGLMIYNIKGKYLDRFGFELQIKSKIESAWADMDHEIFYKNYQYTPLKSSIQNTMNRIGNLLHEIDGLLYSVRQAEHNYERDEEKISIIDSVCEQYQEPIKDFLHVPHYYDFSRINELLYEIHKKISATAELNSLIACEQLNIDFLEYQCDGAGKTLKNFIKLKGRNYDLQSFEYIVLNWLKNIEEFKEDEPSYVNCMAKTIDQYYIEFLLTTLEVSEPDEDLIEILGEVMGHSNSASVFLNSDKYKILHWYNNLIIDIKSEEIEEAIVNGDSRDEIRKRYNCLSIIFGLFIFDNEIINYRDQIISLFDDPLLVNDCYTKMKEIIEKMMKTNHKRYVTLEPFIKINEEILKQVNQFLS